MNGDLTTTSGRFSQWKREYQDECGVPDTSGNLQLPSGPVNPRLLELKAEIDASVEAWKATKARLGWDD